MAQFLWTSIIGSVVLTVLLNLASRLFPGATKRATDTLQQRAAQDWDSEPGPRVKVWFPWKLMLAVSIGLTVLLNLPAIFG